MTKYRILKVVNHYEVDEQNSLSRLFGHWHRVVNLVDSHIKFDTLAEAETAINNWIAEESPVVVKEIGA